jgi:hypothetical protein
VKGVRLSFCKRCNHSSGVHGITPGHPCGRFIVVGHGPFFYGPCPCEGWL